MKLSNKKQLLSLSITLALTLTNCATQINNTPKTNTQLNNVSINNTLTQLKGRVNFPQSFKIKATVPDVRTQATVSLIYPSDYPVDALKDATIATGLTNTSGQFTLNLGSFSPIQGTVYILEAIKRTGGAGNFQMALRTHVKWVSGAWQSMTTPDIDIDTVTTALSIISNLNPQDISSAQTIGTIPSPYTVPNPYNVGNVTFDLLNNVNDLVNGVLANDQDPVASTYFFGGEYLTRTNPAVIGEFQVNTFTNGPQQHPAVAMDSNGDFVVVYTAGYNESGSQDGDRYGIFGQRYNNAGSQVGPEFQVNTFTTGNQMNPAVAMDNAGDFVVAWQSGYGENSQDGDYYGIFAQRYNNNGVKVGSEFQVNTFTTGNQQEPAVAMDSTGDFVVTWRNRYAQDGSYSGVFAQRYSSATTLTPIGSEFRVNSFTLHAQKNPSVAMDSAGDFAVVWEDGSNYNNSQDGSGLGIFAQRFSSASALTPLGSEFQVNTFISSDQSNPSVAMNGSGDFVVSWQSSNQDGDGLGIFAQRYDNGGVKMGSEFQVNTTISNDQDNPTIAIDSAGNFAIAWRGRYADGSYSGVFAQRFDTSGSKVNSEFQVNTITLHAQNYPALAMDSAGDFVVAWQDGNNNYQNGQDGSKSGIFGQRFNKNGVAK